MIGKIPKPGKNFSGCVKYVMLKDDAIILDAEGVRVDKVSHTINDFNMQRKMNPALGQAVGHIALSWSPNDSNKLDNGIMFKVAREYLEKMNIGDTQILIVRHQSAKNPHLHIIYNRVANNGKTVSDKFQYRKNIAVCKDLTLTYDFFIAKDKQQVNRPQLKGADKAKYEIHDAIKKLSRQVVSMEDLKQQLVKQGINVYYKYKINSNEIQGISFSKGGYQFKGSMIDRSLSYSKLSAAIANNIKGLKLNIVDNAAAGLNHASQNREEEKQVNPDMVQSKPKMPTPSAENFERQPISLQLDLFKSSFDKASKDEDLFELNKKKKRKRWPDQGQDMQR